MIEYDELNRLTGVRPKATVPPFCPSCGYNMTGAVSTICPECGEQFDRAKWEQQARLVARRVEQLREADEWAKHAMFLAVGAACAELFCWAARGSVLSMIFSPAAWVGGFVAFFLGVALFRFAPLAVLAPPSKSINPDRFAATLNVVLGLGVMIAGVLL